MDNFTDLPLSSETGTLGVMHLKRYWSRMTAHRTGALPSGAFQEEWGADNLLFSLLGVGLQQSMQKIYLDELSFNDFEQWLLGIHQGKIDLKLVTHINEVLTNGQKQNPVNAIEVVLTSSDMEHWNKHGYVIIKNAIPRQDCEDAINAICEFLGIDTNDPSTWYTRHPAKEGVMVTLFQHPALDRNRHASRIRIAYEQIWQRKDLLVSMDKAGFNPPESDNWKFPGTHLHWDVSLRLPIPFGVQGILYLNDTLAEQGALQVVPGFHHQIDDWLHKLPADVDPRKQDLYSLGPVRIAANAGDFIIWHHALPHSGSPNVASKPRFVQYINYTPAFPERQSEWL